MRRERDVECLLIIHDTNTFHPFYILCPSNNQHGRMYPFYDGGGCSPQRHDLRSLFWSTEGGGYDKKLKLSAVVGGIYAACVGGDTLPQPFYDE